MLLSQSLSRQRHFSLLETLLHVLSTGTMEDRLTWGGAAWPRGGCGAAEQETGSYPFPTLSILAEPFLSALACIILSLLLPLLIPVS